MRTPYNYGRDSSGELLSSHATANDFHQRLMQLHVPKSVCVHSVKQAAISSPFLLAALKFEHYNEKFELQL